MYWNSFREPVVEELKSKLQLNQQKQQNCMAKPLAFYQIDGVSNNIDGILNISFSGASPTNLLLTLNYSDKRVHYGQIKLNEHGGNKPCKIVLHQWYRRAPSSFSKKSKVRNLDTKQTKKLAQAIEVEVLELVQKLFQKYTQIETIISNELKRQQLVEEHKTLSTWLQKIETLSKDLEDIFCKASTCLKEI